MWLRTIGCGFDSCLGYKGVVQKWIDESKMQQWLGRLQDNIYDSLNQKC